jgi:hypothetical protein
MSGVADCVINPSHKVVAQIPGSDIRLRTVARPPPHLNRHWLSLPEIVRNPDHLIKFYLTE